MEEGQSSSDRSNPSISKDHPMFTLPGKTKPIVVTVLVQGVDLQMELDTGASLSLITETTYSNLSSTLSPLTPSNFTLTTYTGEKIIPLGPINVQINYQSQCASLPLLVVPDGPTLLGHNWLEEMKINWLDIKLLNIFSALENRF